MVTVFVPIPVAELLPRLDEFVDRNEHFECYYFPHSDTALAIMNNRTTEPLQGPGRLALLDGAGRTVATLEAGAPR
jgi:hypothetical protein